MGAFGPNHIDFTKGWPSMYVVDLAIPAGDSTITEGMCIYEDDNGVWQKGCPRGRLPYVTGPEQFPQAADVERTQNTNVGEMGRQNMGGVSLTNQVEFDTTAFKGNPKGKYVHGDTDGNFAEVTDLSVHQIAGFCRDVFTDPEGDSVARIVACPVPSPSGVGETIDPISSASSAST